MDDSIHFSDLLHARRDPRLTNALILARKIQRCGGAPWALVIADPDALRTLDPDAQRFIRGSLTASVGGRRTRGLIVDAPAIEWLRWVATSLDTACLFHDPDQFGGKALVIDSMTTEVVRPDPRHLVPALASMLGASIEFQQPPESFVTAIMQDQFREVTDEQWGLLQEKVARITNVGWFRPREHYNAEP